MADNRIVQDGIGAHVANESAIFRGSFPDVVDQMVGGHRAPSAGPAAKLAVTPQEAAALGLGSVRELRQKVMDGLLKKSVLWTGRGKERRRYRFLLSELIRELKEVK